MIADDIIARLAAQVAALAGNVEGAAQLAALQRQGSLPQRSPFAFVIPARRRAFPRAAATGLHIQDVERQFDVVLVIEVADDATGSAGSISVESLEDQVIAALAGWQPAGQIGPLSLAGVSDLDLRDGTLFAQVSFTLPSQLRIAP